MFPRFPLCAALLGLTALPVPMLRADQPAPGKDEKRRLITRTYSVSDLLTFLGDTSDSDRGRLAVQLYRRIETIEPDTWDAYSGPGTIGYYPLAMTLVINQTADVHEKVAELLKTMRSLEEIKVAVDVRTIAVPERLVKELLPAKELLPEQLGYSCELIQIPFGLSSKSKSEDKDADVSQERRICVSLDAKETSRIIEASQENQYGAENIGQPIRVVTSRLFPITMHIPRSHSGAEKDVFLTVVPTLAERSIEIGLAIAEGEPGLHPEDSGRKSRPTVIPVAEGTTFLVGGWSSKLCRVETVGSMHQSMPHGLRQDKKAMEEKQQLYVLFTPRLIKKTKDSEETSEQAVPSGRRPEQAPKDEPESPPNPFVHDPAAPKGPSTACKANLFLGQEMESRDLATKREELKKLFRECEKMLEDLDRVDDADLFPAGGMWKRYLDFDLEKAKKQADRDEIRFGMWNWRD
jgi:hypothetical protein